MAAAPIPSLESSAGLQLEQIAAAGTAVEKGLLADVKSKNPNASYIELLHLFEVRRPSWALVVLGASAMALYCNILAVAPRPRGRCIRLRRRCMLHFRNARGVRVGCMLRVVRLTVARRIYCIYCIYCMSHVATLCARSRSKRAHTPARTHCHPWR
jgi:hypothetical protein